MSPLLFQVPAHDTLTFTVAACLLAGTAFLASYVAARRVMGIDLLRVMRSE
jgi:ABC-type lipoprotein release transport system permease subunit